MTWVNPNYQRVVTADGRITYLRGGPGPAYAEIDDQAMAAAYTDDGPTGPDTVQRSDITEENEVVRFDGVVVRRDPIPTGLPWIDELIEATQNWIMEAMGLIAPEQPWLPAEQWRRATRTPTDIVDAIDQLVDEQLAGGPVDDYNADRYDRCPHCGRHWHGLPLTQRVANMYTVGRFDEDYRVDTDDTPVICEGSDFIGPMRPGAASDTPGQMYIETRDGVDYLTWTADPMGAGESARLLVPILRGEPGPGVEFGVSGGFPWAPLGVFVDAVAPLPRDTDTSTDE